MSEQTHKGSEIRVVITVMSFDDMNTRLRLGAILHYFVELTLTVNTCHNSSL